MAANGVDCTQQLYDEIKKTPDTRLPSAEQSFKEGWQDVMAGNTKPIDSLWDGIDAD